MLAHSPRRWPNIGQTLARCVVFAEMAIYNNDVGERVNVWVGEGLLTGLNEQDNNRCPFCVKRKTFVAKVVKHPGV